MTEPNSNQNPSDIPSAASYFDPSRMPGTFDQFRTDHVTMEDELIEKAIAKVMSKFIENIGNIIIDQIQFLVPYLQVLSLMIMVWILRKLFIKYQFNGEPSVQSVREDSRVPPVVNVDDNSSKKSNAKKSYAGGLKLSVWDTEGIDVRDSTMAKEIAYQKKPMLENQIDLTTQNYEKIRRATKDKVATLRYEEEIEYRIPTQDEEVETVGNIIQNAKSIPYLKVQKREHEVWCEDSYDDDRNHDRRLKSNVLGETLKASLSASARTTIETNYKGKFEIEFEGRKLVSGPLLLWCIMQEMSLAPWQEIDSLKEKFRTATIRNDINKSLDYLNTIVKRVQELGGVIHDSDIISKVHSMMDTITFLDDPKMAEFLQFRNTLRREDQTLAGKGKQGRSSATLIGELKGEYIRIFGELNEKSNERTEAQSDEKDDLETKFSEYPKDKLVQVLALLVHELSKENTDDSDKKNGGDPPHAEHLNPEELEEQQKEHLNPEELEEQQKEKDKSNEEESLSNPDVSVDRTSLNSLRRGNLSFLDSESDSESKD